MYRIFFITALLFTLVARGQTKREYSFTHYTASSGLLSDQVSSVVQDSEGFIWIGTTDGLQRFDGTRYKTFRHSTAAGSIPSNQIRQLLIDSKKNLWVLMGNGRAGIFDTKRFVFREVPAGPARPASLGATLQELHTDEYGHVFLLLARNEVLTYNEQTNELSASDNFFKQKAEWGIDALVQQPGTKKYWISIDGGGLAIYNAATGHLSYPGNNVENEAAIDDLKDLKSSFHFYFDKKGRLWFINWNPVLPLVYCYDPAQHVFVVKGVSFNGFIKAYYEIQGFFEQQDGTIWLKGSPVLAKYLEKENSFEMVANGYRNERSIVYGGITSLFGDHEKNIWVGTDNNGLYRFNPTAQLFTNVGHIDHGTLKTGSGSPMSFMPTKWGTLLVGTWGDGLYEYDRDLHTIPVQVKGGMGTTVNPFAWSMYASRDSNRIWLSSQPGIYIIDQANHSFTYHNPPLLQNQTIRQLVEDKNGDLWLGTHSKGVYKWQASLGKANFDAGMSKFMAIPECIINKIMIDSKGLVWIAAGNNGVYTIDPGNNKIALHFSHEAAAEKKLSEQSATGMLEYDDSTMIITTNSYMMLYNRKSNTSSLIATPDIISGYIVSIEKDRSGSVWLATTHGLYKVNIPNRIFVNFSRSDGIDNDQFIQSASYVLPDGRMLFGTNTNFIVFDPLTIRPDSITPAIHITGFEVMNRSLPVDSLMQLKRVELGYKDNALLIHFSSLLYNSFPLIQYKLEGLDKEWKTAGKNNEAVYSYLPPGSYTFMVRTVNGEGKIAATITQLQIHVKAPFWKTWWFYALLAAMIIILLIWFDRERMKRKEAIEKMRSSIADNLHQQVNTALNNINILSEMAKLKADKDIERSKEYIQQIHSKSTDMIVAMDDMLWNIDPGNDAMQKTIDRLNEHIAALGTRYGVQVQLIADVKITALKLNMQQRQRIFWFLKSGSSIVITTGGSDCNIHIGPERSQLVYTIDFDNTHSDMQQLNNLLRGQEMDKKLEEAKAQLHTEQHSTRSVIVFTIPLIE